MSKSNEILERIKGAEGFKGYGSDAALARFLGIKPQTLDGWKTRGTFDFEIIAIKCKHYDWNWLVNGQSLIEKEKKRDERMAYLQSQVEILSQIIEKAIEGKKQ
jgi:hypothetical protein